MDSKLANKYTYKQMLIRDHLSKATGRVDKQILWKTKLMMVFGCVMNTCPCQTPFCSCCGFIANLILYFVTLLFLMILVITFQICIFWRIKSVFVYLFGWLRVFWVVMVVFQINEDYFFKYMLIRTIFSPVLIFLNCASEISAEIVGGGKI